MRWEGVWEGPALGEDKGEQGAWVEIRKTLQGEDEGMVGCKMSMAI